MCQRGTIYCFEPRRISSRRDTVHRVAKLEPANTPQTQEPSHLHQNARATPASRREWRRTTLPTAELVRRNILSGAGCVSGGVL